MNTFVIFFFCFTSVKVEHIIFMFFFLCVCRRRWRQKKYIMKYPCYFSFVFSFLPWLVVQQHTKNYICVSNKSLDTQIIIKSDSYWWKQNNKKIVWASPNKILFECTKKDERIKQEKRVSERDKPYSYMASAKNEMFFWAVFFEFVGGVNVR